MGELLHMGGRWDVRVRDGDSKGAGEERSPSNPCHPEFEPWRSCEGRVSEGDPRCTRSTHALGSERSHLRPQLCCRVQGLQTSAQHSFSSRFLAVNAASGGLVAFVLILKRQFQ
jgi:hypothetical protein